MLISKTAYIYSEELIEESNRLPTMLNRATIVQDLINSYLLLQDKSKISVIKSQQATLDELKLFHSSYYLEYLEKCNNNSEFNEDLLDEFGLNYDCPILERNYDFIKTIGGSSLTAAKLLNSGKCESVINWFGGWHHAQRDSAEGFCYVNDVVLAIQKLTEKFSKVLYIDLDIHHGNGVQNAFELSKHILTLSFHKLIPGFYPGTGQLHETGLGKGKYYTINVPFLDGITDKSYIKLFHAIFPKVLDKFRPNAIVVQCGADGLNSDPIGECNLTLNGIGQCVKEVINSKIPAIYLGGGGYNFANTARLWAYLTSLIIGCDLEDDIPDSGNYFLKYGPTFELHIEESLKKDSNSEEYVNQVIEIVKKNLNFLE